LIAFHVSILARIGLKIVEKCRGCRFEVDDGHCIEKMVEAVEKYHFLVGAFAGVDKWQALDCNCSGCLV
jgi:hypothetical protein